MNLVKGKSSIVEDEIRRIREHMLSVTPDSDDYDTLLDRFERLNILLNAERNSRISPDTMAVVFGNLAGILIIVGYEHGHVIASRGLNFILRTKHQ